MRQGAARARRRLSVLLANGNRLTAKHEDQVATSSLLILRYCIIPMAFAGTGKIWMNGSMVDWKDATIHVASHVIHYGTGAFEGIARLRLEDRHQRLPARAAHAAHDRLVQVYRMEPKWSQDELSQAVLDTVRVNGFKSCYIRPLVFRGYDSLTLDPRPCPVEAAVIVWEWNQMMGAEALETGIDVGVSSWTRLAPNTLPALAKGTANYANSALIKMQAMLDGYADAVALDESGLLSEGSGQNLFLVRDNVIYTPSLGSSVLQGITRDTVMTLAKDLGFEVRETAIPREFLYLADEAFFCGTAVEITPIRSFDKIVGRQRQARADHRGAAAAVLRDFARRSPRYARLADACRRAGGSPTTLTTRRTGSIGSPQRGPHARQRPAEAAVEKGASDLHLKVGSYPMARIHGAPVRRSATRSSSITRTWSRWPRRSCRRRSGRSSRTRRKSTSPTACPASAASAATCSSSAAPSASSSASFRSR